MRASHAACLAVIWVASSAAAPAARADELVTQEPALVHKSVLGVGVSPDGKWAATASKDGTARLFDLETGKEKTTVQTPLRGWGTSVAFSPDSKTLAAAGDRGVQLLEVATAKELATIKVQVGRNGGVAFSPDGKTLAIAGGGSKVVRRWDVAADQELTALEGHTQYVWGVAYSPDGKTLASVSNDGTLRLWDAGTGKERSALSNGTKDRQLSVAFSPDGKLLATGGGVGGSPEQKGLVRLWDAESGKELAAFASGTAWNTVVAFSPDGKFLATGGRERVVRVWDAATRKEVGTVPLLEEPYSSALAFTPDGGLAVADSRDTVHLWRVQPKK
jgi:WD40 repeat protein